jgi:ribosomal protein L37AE/L43A
MAINGVQFQKGLSMADFMDSYGTEEQCHAALVASRWPDGFVCPHCRQPKHSHFVSKGLEYWQCADCREQTTAICGTIFQATKLPLRRWFLAMHLLTQGQKQRLGAGTQAPSGCALQDRLADEAQAHASHARTRGVAPA